jgi:thiol-disulfide isomerase/thioredoxin
MANVANVSVDEAERVLADEAKAEEDLLDELDDGDFLASYRENRIQELKKQAATLNTLKARDHGQYTELPSEKEFLKLTTATSRCIVHFYKEGFERCRIMDMHMANLARKHYGVKFAKLEVEKAPFFVEKLALKVLPAVIAFKDGLVVERMIGFEAFGTVLPDDFKTEILERRLFECGIFNDRTSRIPGADSDGESSEEENLPKRGLFGR